MATRRPTTIHLSSDIDFLEESSYLIRLELENISAEYSSSSSEEKNVEFDALINLISAESTDANSCVYNEPVIIRIFAANLPNIFFTDLPGRPSILHNILDTNYLCIIPHTYVCRDTHE